MSDKASLHAQYIKEKEDIETLETEYGFINYKIIADQCHIIEIFVIKERRFEGLALQLAQKVHDLAVIAGCTCLLGQVDRRMNGWNSSLTACLSMGMDILEDHGDLVYLIRRIYKCQKQHKPPSRED